MLLTIWLKLQYKCFYRSLLIKICNLLWNFSKHLKLELESSMVEIRYFHQLYCHLFTESFKPRCPRAVNVDPVSNFNQYYFIYILLKVWEQLLYFKYIFTNFSFWANKLWFKCQILKISEYIITCVLLSLTIWYHRTNCYGIDYSIWIQWKRFFHSTKSDVAR